MEDNCQFCGAVKDGDTLDLKQTHYACGSWLPGDQVDRPIACYEAEITALKALVREMAVIIFIKLVYDDPNEYSEGREILNRPAVREITEEKDDNTL